MAGGGVAPPARARAAAPAQPALLGRRGRSNSRSRTPSRRRWPTDSSRVASARRGTSRPRPGSRSSRAGATTARNCSPITTRRHSSCAARQATRPATCQPRARAALIEAGRQAQTLTAHSTAARALTQLALAADCAPMIRSGHGCCTTTRSRDRTPARPTRSSSRRRSTRRLPPGTGSARPGWSTCSRSGRCYRLGDGERADVHYARAAAHAARVPERPIGGHGRRWRAPIGYARRGSHAGRGSIS